MSTAFPRQAANTEGLWNDHDQPPNMNRGHSNSLSSAQMPGSTIQGQNRARNGFGANGEKAVPVPGYGNGVDRKSSIGGSGGASLFDMARSPPNASNKSKSAHKSGENWPSKHSKDTKHVPCKFFRQGACQAGNACPFSHSLDPMSHQAPCKYFMKVGFSFLLVLLG